MSAKSSAPADLRLESLPDLDTACAEWTALAEGGESVFATWEWADCWWRHFGAGHELRLIGCRSGPELVGLLAFAVRRRAGLRVLRFLGYGPGDELGPVFPAGKPELAYAGLHDWLANPDGWDLLLAERMRGDLPTTDVLPAGAHMLRGEASPTIELGRSFDELLAARSSNFRGQVRRRERKLAREHELSLRLTTDAASLDADLDTLFALHELRWPGERTSFLAATAFHREFAAVALERGWLRLWIAELDGRPAAAWYGFRLGGVEAFYQSGRDPALDKTSVGFVLMSHTIRCAADDGMREYRLLRGDEGYKGRFADGDDGLDTFVAGGTALGRAAAGTATALVSRPRARRLLSRVAGS